MSVNETFEIAAKLCDEVARAGEDRASDDCFVRGADECAKAIRSAIAELPASERSPADHALIAANMAAQLRLLGWTVTPPPRASLDVEGVEQLIIDGSEPIIPGIKGLAPAPTFAGKVPKGSVVYKDIETGDCWLEYAWIIHPATCLQNLRTSTRHIEIIGSRTANRFEAIGRVDLVKHPHLLTMTTDGES